MSFEPLTASTFDVNRMIFGEAKKCPISGTTMSFWRVPITYQYGPNVIGKLSIRTGKKDSWGIKLKEIKDDATKETVANSYQKYICPLSMYPKDAQATEDEKKEIAMWEALTERVKEHLCMPVITSALRNPNWKDQVKLLSPFMWQFDEKTGMADKTKAPSIFPRLETEWNEKPLAPGQRPKFRTVFRRGNKRALLPGANTIIDPYSVMRKPCRIIALINVDHVYIGAQPMIQLRLKEAFVFKAPQTYPKLTIDAADVGDDDGEEEDEEEKGNVGGALYEESASVSGAAAAKRRRTTNDDDNDDAASSSLFDVDSNVGDAPFGNWMNDGGNAAAAASNWRGGGNGGGGKSGFRA